MTKIFYCSNCKKEWVYFGDEEKPYVICADCYKIDKINPPKRLKESKGVKDGF